MNSAVCTLFEGSYHYGVAALTNSLHKAGFRGELYAGYRGAFPNWAAEAQPLDLAGFEGASALIVAAGLRIVFIPLRTDYHLTNYKPDFMLALLDGPARSVDALFYLDPDICVVERWTYFEDWVGCGIALCEDVNSPLPEHHPRRVGWRRYYAEHGLHLGFRSAEYINGGFIGVKAGDRSFLELWKRLMTLMADEIGSLSLALVANESYRSAGFANCFDRTDQDGLNAALELSAIPISVIGKEAMGLRPGLPLVPHALGHSKPWQRNYVRWALSGMAPRVADKVFWANVAYPLSPYSWTRRALKKADITAAAAIGRVFARA